MVRVKPAMPTMVRARRRSSVSSWRTPATTGPLIAPIIKADLRNPMATAISRVRMPFSWKGIVNITGKKVKLSPCSRDITTSTGEGAGIEQGHGGHGYQDSAHAQGRPTPSGLINQKVDSQARRPGNHPADRPDQSGGLDTRCRMCPCMWLGQKVR